MAILKYLLLIILSLILLYPLWLMITGSLLEMQDLAMMPPRLIPWNATIKNYQEVLSWAGIGRWTKNTLTVVVGIVGTASLVSFSSGYALSIYRFRGRKLLFTFLLAMIVIPMQVLIVPQVIFIRIFGLNNTYFAGIIPRSLSVMGIFLFKNFIDRIPKEMIESGRIDGAGDFAIMGRLVAPMCLPIFGTVMLFHGIAAFQDFLWQLLVMQGPKVRTLIVGLTITLRKPAFVGNKMGLSLTVGAIMFLPLFVVYAATSKLFLRGLTMSGVKG